jgi:hypothetical protein
MVSAPSDDCDDQIHFYKEAYLPHAVPGQRDAQ